MIFKSNFIFIKFKIIIIYGISKKNNIYKSAIDHAREINNQEIVEILSKSTKQLQ